MRRAADHPQEGKRHEHSVGGGLWLQGVTADITHTTFANNRLGANLFFGQAILLVNNNRPSATVANIATVVREILGNQVDFPRALQLEELRFAHDVIE